MCDSGLCTFLLREEKVFSCLLDTYLNKWIVYEKIIMKALCVSPSLFCLSALPTSLEKQNCSKQCYSKICYLVNARVVKTLPENKTIF